MSGWIGMYKVSDRTYIQCKQINDADRSGMSIESILRSPTRPGLDESPFLSQLGLALAMMVTAGVVRDRKG